jgi:hypothetical protein
MAAIRWALGRHFWQIDNFRGVMLKSPVRAVDFLLRTASRAAWLLHFPTPLPSCLRACFCGLSLMTVLLRPSACSHSGAPCWCPGGRRAVRVITRSWTLFELPYFFYSRSASVCRLIKAALPGALKLGNRKRGNHRRFQKPVRLETSIETRECGGSPRADQPRCEFCYFRKLPLPAIQVRKTKAPKLDTITIAAFAMARVNSSSNPMMLTSSARAFSRAACSRYCFPTS